MHLFQTRGAHHGQPWFPLMLVLWDTITKLEFVQELHDNLNHGQQVEVIITDYYKNSTTKVYLEKSTHELQTSSAADLNKWSLRLVFLEQYP